MLTDLVHTLLKPQHVENFPWILAEMELRALGIILVESIAELMNGRTIISYLPVPNTPVPTGMIVEFVNEQ
ncbi:hypothetical protein [Vibrio phage phiKT1028]|nr:hypothetical protein [Vibrio phage phiKT1028]